MANCYASLLWWNDVPEVVNTLIASDAMPDVPLLQGDLGLRYWIEPEAPRGLALNISVFLCRANRVFHDLHRDGGSSGYAWGSIEVEPQGISQVGPYRQKWMYVTLFGFLRKALEFSPEPFDLAFVFLMHCYLPGE